MSFIGRDKIDAPSCRGHYRRSECCQRRRSGHFIVPNPDFSTPGDATAHNKRGIEMARGGNLPEALAHFDRAVALKPDYAEAYNNRALILQDLNRLDDALASLDRALALTPDNARAHNNRGALLQDLNRFDEAIAAHEKALVLKPDFAEAQFNNATALRALKRFDEAIAGFDKTIALRPDYPEAYQNLGITLQDEKRIEEAIAAYRKAIALRPNYAEAYSNLGFCELQLGQFEAGFRDYEARKQQAGLPDTRFITRPEWRGENIAGKTLFVHCEQGFGDTLQFCRFGKVAAARGIKAVMSVQQPLWRLLQQLRPAADIVVQDTAPATFDYHCSLMSLPGPLGINAGAIPVEQRYLTSDPALSRVWSDRLPQRSAKPRIGVTWSGNPKHKNEINRSMPLKVLSPLFAAGAHWVSLQTERRPDDAGLLAELPVAPLADALTDFADTAALIDNLDLVITVDTSVAHLAGAMGKPVWILLPYYPDWRWFLEGETSPWYPSARLFRQDRSRSWENVIARVREAVHEFVRSPLPSSPAGPT
jgi:Flp pilus assembly protein TadD